MLAACGFLEPSTPSALTLAPPTATAVNLRRHFGLVAALKWDTIGTACILIFLESQLLHEQYTTSNEAIPGSCTRPCSSRCAQENVDSIICQPMCRCLFYVLA